MFDRPYFGKFTLEIGVKNEIAEKYFSPVKVNNTLRIDVNPAYLSKIKDNEEDTLS